MYYFDTIMFLNRRYLLHNIENNLSISCLKILYFVVDLNPLSPHDALKHHSTSLNSDLIFLQLRFQTENSHKNGLPVRGNFL